MADYISTYTTDLGRKRVIDAQEALGRWMRHDNHIYRAELLPGDEQPTNVFDHGEMIWTDDPSPQSAPNPRNADRLRLRELVGKGLDQLSAGEYLEAQRLAITLAVGGPS